MPIELTALLAPLSGEFWAQEPRFPAGVWIAGLSCDSRSLRAGELFFALPGERVDGARFVDEAWRRGAAAIAVEGEVAVPAGPGPVLRARSVRKMLGVTAALYHGEPARHLRVVGITGTDGKTSSAWFVQQLLAAQGRRAASLGTLGVKGPDGQVRPWDDAVRSAGAVAEPARTWSPTTPEAPLFQATLARLHGDGVEDVVAEISSHALAQDRTYGTQFAAVALTHVSADHLDFHVTRDEYLAAKAKLFAPATRGGPLERTATQEVLNVDDELGLHLAAQRDTACITYGRRADARVRLLAGDAGPDGIRLEIAFDGERQDMHTPLLGRFHLENLLTAAAIAYSLAMRPAEIAAALPHLTAVPGRFEAIRAGQPFTIIVDYAHTADGLAKLLTAAREIGHGRTCLVFGCGGDRDRGKREPMGEIAGRLADHVIVTSDNPRSEDPAEIAAAVARGVARGSARAATILDRRQALSHALSGMGPDDTLVVAGRGSEHLQIFRDRVEEFDDRDVLRELLRVHTAPPGDVWSLGAIAHMTRATVAGVSPQDWHVIAALTASGVALDSRRVAGGEVFVALAGEKVDGHTFAEEALEAGACAVVVARSWWSRRKAARARGAHLLVADTREALQQWAQALRQSIAPRLLAITGSTGKTTTKELVLALLGAHPGVVGTVGNRNNEIGLPWTLLQLRRGDRWAVVEMGANHRGEIAKLTRIAAPDVAVITGVGRAHLGHFGGLPGVLEAKLEILEGLSPSGAVVIPDDDPLLESELQKRWAGSIVRFGCSARADLRATRVTCALDGTTLELAGVAEPLHVQLLGTAAARAVLAALAAVRALGVPEVDLERLAQVPPLAGRLDPRHVQGVTWILDVYNASPESTLHALAWIAGVACSGRRVFVFGGMRELGEESAAIHNEIGSAAGFCDAAVFVGDEARLAAPAAQRSGARQVLWCDGVPEVVRFLGDYLAPGDIVLLKGARAAGLERVAIALGVVGEDYGQGRA